MLHTKHANYLTPLITYLVFELTKRTFEVNIHIDAHTHTYTHTDVRIENCTTIPSYHLHKKTNLLSLHKSDTRMLFHSFK